MEKYQQIAEQPSRTEEEKFSRNSPTMLQKEGENLGQIFKFEAKRSDTKKRQQTIHLPKGF
jgi:hypothetical protein